MQGLVIKSTGSQYLVRLEDATDILCHIKGNFRIRGIRTTSPVAVGDRVEVEQQPDGTAWITSIETRRNYIIRRATNLSKEAHILAANIDQVALLVTVNHPITSTTFIDRFLATAEAYSVPAILIFNKTDLLTEDELQQLDALRQLYESLGYPTLAISALQQTVFPCTEGKSTDSLARLLAQFDGKTTLLAGNSGVGKSTLLNAIFGREMTRTGLISSAHDKGMHTTTFSEMYPLSSVLSTPNSSQAESDNTSSQDATFAQPQSGWLIDTPGIKGFGSVDMQKEEVSHYFREIFETAASCRYNNCLHTGEPGCAVQEAVVQNKIALTRFESYLSLLGDCDESKYR